MRENLSRVCRGTGPRRTMGTWKALHCSSLRPVHSEVDGVRTGRDNPIILYLNALVIRVHGMIYRGKLIHEVLRKMNSCSTGPDAFRRNLIYVIISTSIFVGFGFIGFLLGLKEPGFIEIIVPEHIISTVESGKVWFKDVYSIAPMASSSLMTHNISVTFLIVAIRDYLRSCKRVSLGAQRLLIGTVAALCMKHDLSLELWSSCFRMVALRSALYS